MYNQGDVLLINVPFTDLTSTKKRPVMVISNNHYNSKTQDIVIVAITSNISSLPYATVLDVGDMANGTLPAKSIIRADKIYTLSQSIVIKKIGDVKTEILDAVNKVLHQLFDTKV